MELVASREHLQQASLSQLAQRLQENLLALPGHLPFQVQCVLKCQNLMVLAQHPPDEAIDPQQVFSELTQTIGSSLTPALIQTLFEGDTIPADAEAKLYLRRLGQKLPYGSHHFSLLGELPPLLPNAPATDQSPDEPKYLENSLDRQSSPDWEEGLALAIDDPLSDEVLLLTDAPEPDSLEADEAPERSPWLLWIAAGLGVSAVSFAMGVFLMTRPCMADRCDPLQKAQGLTTEANQTIQTAQTGLELQQAQQQLQQADQLLNTVPPWSRHHGNAVALQQTNQTNVLLLTQVVAAEKLAAEADQKTRTIPQPVQEWQNIQSTWRGAIAQLEKLPQSPSLSDFVRQRLKQYQESLALTNQYISAEKQAQKHLATAKSTATVAQARQGTAQTIAQLQQVQATWQVAVNALKQVPNTTTSFTEAQQLLTDYNQKLAIARERVSREDLAQTSFNQAVAQANRATSLQQQNQWTQAVANWRSAIAAIGRIPEGTPLHEQAQSLEASYASSLQKAEAQLQVAMSQQKLQSDLNRVCSGSPKICNFLILSDSIRVQFTPAYENALKQAYATGQAGNYAMLGGAVNHIDSLQSALQSISNNAGLPIEVYNANGSELMGSFSPVRQ